MADSFAEKSLKIIDSEAFGIATIAIGLVAATAGAITFVAPATFLTLSLTVAGGMIAGLAGAGTTQLALIWGCQRFIKSPAAPLAPPSPALPEIKDAPLPESQTLKDDFDAEAVCKLQRDIPASKPPVFVTAHKKGY